MWAWCQVIVEGREIQSDGGEKDKDTPKTNQTKPTAAHRPRLHQVVFPLYEGETSETKTADYLWASVHERRASQQGFVLQQNLKEVVNWTSLLPVTSGHCTGWQKHGHNASSRHWYSLTQVSGKTVSVRQHRFLITPLFHGRQP